MKKIKSNIAAACMLVMVAFAGASCSSESNGAGDAVIGFGQAEYTFSEDQTASNGYVRLPLTITGEAKKYPISFSVEATMITEDENIDDIVVFTQTDNLKYVGDPKAPACVEMYIVNDTQLNGTRKFALTLKDVKGAEVGQESTIISIEDDDNPEYLDLCGDWTFTATGLTSGATETFDVNISEGFTDSEIESNKSADRLLCWGFANEQKVYPSANRTHQAEWYLQCNKNTNDINIIIGSVMTTEATFDVGTQYAYYGTISASQIPVGAGDISIDSESLGISGSWSADHNTITFTPSAGFGAMIVGSNNGSEYNITGYFMGDIYYNIVMTRK